MAYRDLYSNVITQRTLSPQVVTADVNGVGVDTRDADSVLFVAEAGAIVSSGLVIPVAQESDDNSVFTNVAAADLRGAFVNLVADSVQKVGYVGNKRYVRLVADYLSGTSVVVAGQVVLSHLHQQPSPAIP